MGAHKSDSNRLVHVFFEPLGPKWKYSEEKIHLFYRIIKVQISGGLPTDYMCNDDISPRSLRGGSQVTKLVLTGNLHYRDININGMLCH